MVRFFTIVNKVIGYSDIVLEVLDARFIDETRSIRLEEKILKAGKKLIFVINKVDLVESHSIKKKIKGLQPRVEISATKRQGTGILRDLIKQYCQQHKENTVGVVGYPNTGKSSIINALCGRGAAPVSPTSGHTRAMRRVRLTANIFLFDTPGVFPPVEDSDHILVSAIDYTKAQDPDYYVDLIFEKFPGVLENHYKIKSLDEFAVKRNLLLKGGVPDVVRAAKAILMDWQQGRIKV